MKAIAAMDIETFFSKRAISKKDLKYLKKREKNSLKFAINPFVSIVVSSAFFYLYENYVEVLYLSNYEKEESEKIPLSEKRVIDVNYIPVKLDISDPVTSERYLLINIMDRLKNLFKLITFNGLDFDIEFIKIRMIYHNLSLEVIKKFSSTTKDHIDLCKLFNFGKKIYSLEFIANRMGIPIKKGPIAAKDVEKCFKKGMYIEIARYNARDAVIEGLLYEKFMNSSEILALKNLNIFSGDELIDYCIKNKIITRKEASDLITYLKSLLCSDEEEVSSEQLKYIQSLKNNCIERNIEIRLEDVYFILNRSLKKIQEEHICRE